MRKFPAVLSLIVAGLSVGSTTAIPNAFGGSQAPRVQLPGDSSGVNKQVGTRAALTKRPRESQGSVLVIKGSGKPGGLRGASLAAAVQILASRATDGYFKPVLGQGKADGRFGAVMPRANKVVVTETHAPGLISTYVFKRSLWATKAKPFKLVKMLLPTDLTAAPSDDPAFLNNGLGSPGADAPFEVMSIGEGVKRKEAYRRAHQQAQKTGNNVIFQHNKRIYTVTRNSPPTLAAYEQSGVKVPELGIDL